MTELLVLMAVAGFCMGGAVAFRRQRRPVWVSVLLVVVSVGLLYWGARTVN